MTIIIEVKGTNHCHEDKIAENNHKARRKLITACSICFIFMTAEIVGGYLSNSLAITTDAAHLLSDLASFVISLSSLYLSARSPTKRMLFGWHRAEVMGAVISVLMIWLVTGILVYMAIQRIIHCDYEIDAEVMLITSGLGVILNIIMGFTLQQPGSKETKQENINVKAALIHVLGDLLQSVGVFIAALTIYFKNDWLIVDPICTFIFSIIVLITTITIMKDTVVVLMEGVPSNIHFEDVMNILLSVEGVKRVHGLRIWALSIDKINMSAHLAIGPGANHQAVLKSALKAARSKHNFFDITLQIEDFEELMDECEQCKSPIC